MSNTMEQHLRRIQDKLQLLLKQYEAVQKENKKLKEELGSSRQQAVLQQETIEKLKQQVEILKLNTGEMNEADKKQFEKRINAYLKEIDRCIVMLSA